MAKKKELNVDLVDLKKNVTEGMAVIGKEMVLKSLRNDTLAKVYLAENCPDELLGDITHYCNILKVPVIKLDVNNEKIGLLCKKQHFISVLGIKKK